MKTKTFNLLMMIIMVGMFVSCGDKPKSVQVQAPKAEVQKPDPIRKNLGADTWKAGWVQYFVATTTKADKVEVKAGEIYFTAGDQVYIVGLPEGFVVKDSVTDGECTVYLTGTFVGQVKQLVLYGNPANADKKITPDIKAKKITYRNGGNAKKL